MKRCWISLVTREMQIKMTTRYHTYLLEWLRLRRLILTSHEELEHSYTAGRNVKRYSHLGEEFGSVLKAKHMPAIWSSHSTSGYLLKRNESTCPHKHLYKNVHSSCICNRQQVETIQMSTDRWMDKGIVACPSIELLLSN